MSNEASYSSSLHEIEEIIALLESGEADIDNILENVKRASELIKYCKSKLYATEKDLNNFLNDLNEE